MAADNDTRKRIFFDFTPKGYALLKEMQRFLNCESAGDVVWISLKLLNHSLELQSKAMSKRKVVLPVAKATFKE